MGKSNAERQAALRARRERLGLVQVLVWVPKDAVARLRAYAKRLASSASAQRGE